MFREIFLLILKSARLWFTACGIIQPNCCQSMVWNAALQTTDRQQSGCIIPHAVNHSLALLSMGKKLPETCWADWKINNFLVLHLVGSSTLFISMMHGETHIKNSVVSNSHILAHNVCSIHFVSYFILTLVTFHRFTVSQPEIGPAVQNVMFALWSVVWVGLLVLVKGQLITPCFHLFYVH